MLFWVWLYMCIVHAFNRCCGDQIPIVKILEFVGFGPSFITWSDIKQDPVSTMQKTGWTIHSPFLVLFGLKKNFTLDVITRGQSTTIFLCIGPFLARWRTTKQTNNRVILVQACSWPPWEGSLLQSLSKIEYCAAKFYDEHDFGRFDQA